MYVRKKHKKIFELNNEERHNPKIWDEAINTRFLDMTENNFGRLRDQLDETYSAITLYKMFAYIKAQETVLVAHQDNTRKERRTWKKIAAIYMRIVELRLYDIRRSVWIYVNNEVLKLSAQNTKNVDYYHIQERGKLNERLLKKSHKAKTVAESFAVYDEVHYIAQLFEQDEFKAASTTLS
ncbi:MAG TPA: hypothetical protein VFD05_03045 [Bacilli bacterium]|nr:hypothetical protein [Bacilli bacterium]